MGQRPSDQTVDFWRGPLKLSLNKRFLVHSDGTPFSWLGDTAWELLHRLNREQAIQYLDLRAKQKYTLIQAVALADHIGFLPTWGRWRLGAVTATNQLRRN